MKLDFLKSIGGPAFQKTLLKASKYAPEVLTGVGIAATIGSTILVARATTKLAPIANEARVRILEVKETKEQDTTGTYTTYGKDLTLAYARNSVDFIKLYGPGISLGVGGVISILAAHGIMRRRVVVWMGAYKALEASFQAYRERVIEEYGEDKDRDFRLGFKTVTETDKETGKKVKTRIIDPDTPSLYAKWFDDSSTAWTKDPDYNLAFIKTQQNWANDKLKIRGFLFLHEVYEMLGIRTTPEAQVVGWVMDAENGGDLDVDFNIYNADAIGARDFVNGLTNAILLDFNVDGVILDKI